MAADPQFKPPEQLRNYQAELFEIVKKQNSILFLPTGSGKTCIAIWLIKHLASDLKKPYSEGGKRTIFLVNTTELAYQQAAYVTEAGNFKVRVVCANEGVDSWNREQWEELEEFEVIVLTAQCYLNALIHGFMLLQNANLLIFDECHHATKGHPMREIMQTFATLPPGNNGPRVLGLSATILNRNRKNDPVEKLLAELENTFRSSIVTTTFTQDVKKYSTKPNEVIKDFVKLQLPSALAEFLKVQCEESENLANCFKLKDHEIVEQLMESKPGILDVLINAPGLNRTKMLIGAIKDINVHCHEFGIFIGFMACHLYIIQMCRFMFVLERTQYVDLVLYFMNVAQVMRKTLYNEIMKINGKFSMEAMMKMSTEKLKYLFDVLRTLERTDKCIIFVERKITAKALYSIIKWFARLEKVSNINVDFITGTDCNPLRNTRELLHEKKMKEKILKSFRGDHLNVLIATNIVEEGIDIPNCGLVIMFDEIKSYRSYVQSKGRARLQSSKYIVLNEVPRETFLARLKGYRDVEMLLNKAIREKDISNRDDDDSPDGSESGKFYITSQNACIKEENCVSLIHQYCSSLPSDIYTQLIPYWWSSDAGEEKICKLQLPINSPIREILVGPPRPKLKKSKQTVAFEAVKLLHQLGGLNDQLLPVKGSAALEDTKEWVPNWEESTTQDSVVPSVGQEQFISKLKLSTFLQDSRPVANEESYIHFIDIKPEYEVPDVNRKKFCHKLMAYDYNFGILTRKPLPNLCRFPVYSDLGRCQVSILSNCELVVLDEKQISYVARFHKFLFFNVIRKVKEFLLFDARSTSGFFIVPLTRKETGADIAWKVVRQKIETVVRRPSELDRETEEFSEENYLGKVVAPWYRNVDDPMFYIVTNFFSGLHLHSELDNKNITYGEHFEKAYNLRALQPGQPMMEVRSITKNFDCIKPRPVPASAKQKKKNNEDKPTYLPPEFVTKQALNSVYWYKSILLPSILHRIQQLLLAEDLRQTLVEKTGVGRFDITIDRSEENEYFLRRTVEVPVTVQHISKIRNLRINERKTLIGSEKIPDLVCDINHCEDFSKLTLEDIQKYVDYVEQPLNSGKVRAARSNLEDCRSDGNTGVDGEYVIRYMPAPPLITLRDNVDSAGPNQYEILKALTLRGANDSIDLERYETLGDSLLKYLVSFAIFIREGRMNEGLLTSLKGRIVGNKYLFDCAKKHQIPDYIQATTFVVDKSWIPPLFCVPPYLSDIIPALNKFSSLLKVTIPYHEQFSGNLSRESVDSIGDKLKEFFQSVEDIDKNDESMSSFFLGLRKLSHKSIADVIEALIGVYLQTCGIGGAFNVMKYFGILQKEDYKTLMSHRIPSPVRPENQHKILNMIPDYRKLECLLNYEFRDKALLLQALTHPSCFTNQLTDCYQKLEFIGDAVLDFLITSYIYEYCGQLSPGQITDLRSSLVNNNTFGALAVRLGLQKYILDHNKNLEEAIMSFVSYQKSQNYEIHGNDMMTLVNEGDTVMAEEIDVPKALGDIFESIAGAIFVDSEYNCSVVWNIYFNIMAEEIAKFCSKIPLNPIRLLHERFVNKVKFNTDEKKNKEAEKNGDRLIVRLCVHTKKESHTFTGRGVNTSSAKRAAAKLALKHLGYSEFVI